MEVGTMVLAALALLGTGLGAFLVVVPIDRLVQLLGCGDEGRRKRARRQTTPLDVGVRAGTAGPWAGKAARGDAVAGGGPTMPLQRAAPYRPPLPTSSLHRRTHSLTGSEHAGTSASPALNKSQDFPPRSATSPISSGSNSPFRKRSLDVRRETKMFSSSASARELGNYSRCSGDDASQDPCRGMAKVAEKTMGGFEFCVRSGKTVSRALSSSGLNPR
ncbi:hypothetical protein FVE85_2649 [Porphyridium purpureum]|uniref:Uncharacterized protein n=1 Tax=Porphyridium purpureum TaxID=35688 RepID=A0A5J4YT54_PORPP|nr:hypothetical protein FVE85_2649 [Porphyridium purpureum]|eukprot:POR1974..scf227_4